jgi:ABC-type Fe3+ transport system permease subunit
MDRTRVLSVVWPAFLGACLLEMLVFAVVDPYSLQWQGQALSWSRQGVYSLAFFAFWAVAVLVGCLTLLVGQPVALPTDRSED